MTPVGPARAPAVLTVGLTGNAGSGKSTVARVWEERGVEVIDADELAREIVDTNPELRRRLAVEFGDEILEPPAGAQVELSSARSWPGAPSRTLQGPVRSTG